MPTSTFNDTVVQGISDVQQLQVRGVSGQTQPLQTWQDNVGNANSRVTNQGYLQAGDVATQTALIEANETATLPTGKPLSGFHSLGSFSGPLGSALNWIVHELQLLGTGALNGLFVAHRSKLTYGNQNGTANATNAVFRAGDFQAINQSTLSATPTKQLAGLRGTASNNAGAYLNQANAVEGAITNDTGGSITQAAAFSVVPPVNNGSISTLIGLQVPDLSQGAANYALYTGQGIVHLGDTPELKTITGLPAGNPPAGFVKIYPKIDSGIPRLYSKDPSGVERSVGVRAAQSVIRDNNANYATSSPMFVDLDAVNFVFTLTINSGAVLLGFSCMIATNASAGNPGQFDFTVDGVRIGSAGADGLMGGNIYGVRYPVSLTVLKTGLSQGSHTFKVQWKSSVSPVACYMYAGDGTANNDFLPNFWVMEV